MRQIRPSIVGLVACVLALTTVSRVSAQTTSDGIAKVVAVSGDARYFVPGDSKPHELKNGMLLKQGTIIQTASGQNNYVDIVLNNSHAVAAPTATETEISHYQPKAEQDGIRIRPNSVLSIDKLTVTETGADTITDTELDLKAGSVLGTVKKLSPTSKYEVKIPNGVAGIRGTIYSLSADGILKVLTGSVVVAYVGNDGNVITQVVNAGEQFDMNTGILTPLAGPGIGDLVRDAVHFRTIFVNTGTTYVSPDHIIHYVSPTKGNGKGNHGNGNGNGGGNGTGNEGGGND
jgi:hypothetical protein